MTPYQKGYSDALVKLGFAGLIPGAIRGATAPTPGAQAPVQAQGAANSGLWNRFKGAVGDQGSRVLRNVLTPGFGSTQNRGLIL